MHPFWIHSMIGKIPKILFFILTGFFIIAESTPQQQRLRLEEPVAIVYSVDPKYSAHVICSSDLGLPTFDGHTPTVQDLILEQAYYYKALMRGLPLEDMAKKHWTVVKSQLRMTDQQMEETCTKWGMSMQEVYEKFKKMGARSSLVEYDVVGRIFIPEHEVEKAYEEHPVFQESRYQLQISYVPSDAKRSVEEQKIKIKENIQKNPQSFQWKNPFWLPESDIAQDKEFITHMEPQQIEVSLDPEGYFEIIKMCQKQEGCQIPLQQCYKDIVTNLRRPKMEELLEKYNQDLLKSVAIVSLDDTHELPSSVSC